MGLSNQSNRYTPQASPSLNKDTIKDSSQSVTDMKLTNKLGTQNLKKGNLSISRNAINNLAYFTNKGILIKNEVPESANRAAGSATKSAMSGSSRDGAALQDDYEHGVEYNGVDSDDEDGTDAYETTSLISCVTCLSGHSLSTLSFADSQTGYGDDNSRLLSSSSSSNSIYTDALTGEEDAHGVKTLLNDFKIKSVHLPNNSVIPFSKVLNCKPVVDIEANSTVYDSTGNLEPVHLVEITFAKDRRQDLVPKSSVLKVTHAEYSKLLKEYQTLTNSTDVKELSDLVSWKSFPQGEASRPKRILVIINPKGGKGKANKLFLTKARPILLASGCLVDYKETTYHREAYHFTKKYPFLSKYDVITCASGDGIPHEVLNGLYKRKHDRVELFNKISLTQIPCGSGNAMSVSCHGTSNPSHAALNLLKGRPTRTDLMLITQPSYFTNEHGIDDDDEEPHRVSFLSQAYGIIAESDINTEYLRFMGPSRFEIGVTSCVLRRKKFPCEVFVKYGSKTKKELRDHFNKYSRYVQSFPNSSSSLPLSSEEDQSLVDIDSPFENTNSSSKANSDTLTEEDFKPEYEFPENSIKYTDDIPDDWEQIDSSLTKNCGIFYTGKMPYIAEDCKFFPAALPDDGVMDLVITDARTSITRTASILLSLDKGSHVLQPEVVHSKVKALRLIPHVTKSVISVDGENFPLEPMQVEVLPRICKVIMLSNGNFVDTKFDSM
ncbi:hypothetical protein ACO0QE_003620 [Hanseniaspora vineae]